MIKNHLDLQCSPLLPHLFPPFPCSSCLPGINPTYRTKNWTHHGMCRLWDAVVFHMPESLPTQCVLLDLLPSLGCHDHLHTLYEAVRQKYCFGPL